MNTEQFIKNLVENHAVGVTTDDHVKITVDTVIGIINGFKKHWKEPYVEETLDEIVEKLKKEFESQKTRTSSKQLTSAQQFKLSGIGYEIDCNKTALQWIIKNCPEKGDLFRDEICSPKIEEYIKYQKECKLELMNS